MHQFFFYYCVVQKKRKDKLFVGKRKEKEIK
jgi:hypothetical protein